MRALVVDADPGVRRVLESYLAREGIEVTVVADAATGWRILEAGGFGLVMLGMVGGDSSGLELIRALRQSGSSTHVIVISDAGSELDRVRALHSGADDYVTKPFFVRELTARAVAVRRRIERPSPSMLECGQLRIDLAGRAVTLGGDRIPMTTKEFDLLSFLAGRPGVVFSREDLLRSVWQSASAWQQDKTVNEHVRRIREKLGPTVGDMVVSVRGVGYRFDGPGGASTPPVPTPAGASAEDPGRHNPGAPAPGDGPGHAGGSPAGQEPQPADDEASMVDGPPTASRPLPPRAQHEPAPHAIEDAFACPDDRVSLQVAAARLGVHYQTAYRWVRSAVLPAVKVRGVYEVRIADLAAMDASRRQPTPPPAQRIVRSWDRFAERLYAALLVGEESTARELVAGLVTGGVRVVDCCDRIVAPALFRIGQHWEAGELSVAEEHRSSTICQRIIGMVTPSPPGRPRGTAVVCTPADDEHSLPGSMAAAVLREDHWRVHHFGVGVPADEVVAMSRRLEPDLAVISSVWAPAQGAAGALAVALRHSGTRVLVGGAGRRLGDLVLTARARAGPRTAPEATGAAATQRRRSTS